ncbi:demethylmenaquinone methyltransferase [Striga asiatica]|uniref:Demethylmenaquinone methyltransferase n=1 Tax=Striga asiatica TaxID=4170 RepID=A0A5A7PJW4_STRAF|nr:demethylmenaquinone methyltransferase [Striga asiatica]
MKFLVRGLLISFSGTRYVVTVERKTTANARWLALTAATGSTTTRERGCAALLGLLDCCDGRGRLVGACWSLRRVTAEEQRRWKDWSRQSCRRWSLAGEQGLLAVAGIAVKVVAGCWGELAGIREQSPRRVAHGAAGLLGWSHDAEGLLRWCRGTAASAPVRGEEELVGLARGGATVVGVAGSSGLHGFRRWLHDEERGKR